MVKAKPSQAENDQLIVEIERLADELSFRGLGIAAARMEECLCEIYSALNLKIPDERLARLEQDYIESRFSNTQQ